LMPLKRSCRRNLFVPELALILLVVFLAGIVQSITGFGFGLVLVSLLSLSLPVKTAVVFNVVPALTINVILGWRLRSHLRWDHLKFAAVAAVVCTPVGVLLVSYLNEKVMNGILALILLMTLLQALLGSRITQRPWHHIWLGTPMGAFAGLLSGSYGVGGPPLVAYVRSRHYDRFAYVVSVQVLLAMSAVCRVISLLWQDTLTAEQWAINGMAAAVVIPAIFIGMKLLKHLPNHWLNRLVLAMLGIIMLNVIMKLLH
ncbi:MAG: sulfite exporter TauE/SafE family protein, partial [Phycisphaeraceae bacterium JB051]